MASSYIGDQLGDDAAAKLVRATVLGLSYVSGQETMHTLVPAIGCEYGIHG
jgi:hypothetical protein